MSLNAFMPQGNTIAITVDAVSSTAQQAVNAQGQGLGPGQYMIQNIGTVAVYFNAGSTSAVAAATIPLDATPSPSTPISAGAVMVLTFQPNAWFTAIAGGAGSVLYITPGDGN